MDPQTAGGLDEKKLARVARILLELPRDEQSFWPWLSESRGRRPDKRSANKFLLGCVLDYQIPAELAWANAKRLAEDILGDPEDLWDQIAAVPLPEWLGRREAYRLHRFPKGHERVRTIGARLAQEYRGDARRLWEGLDASRALENLVNIGLGEQLSRMALGALFDTLQVTGRGDVKADTHVRRVSGRVFAGQMLDPKTATALTTRLNPENPWRIDQPLYLIGKTHCFARDPDCLGCPLAGDCVHRENEGPTSPNLDRS